MADKVDDWYKKSDENTFIKTQKKKKNMKSLAAKQALKAIYKKLGWSLRQESNLYLALRRHSFYPLNYEETKRALVSKKAFQLPLVEKPIVERKKHFFVIYLLILFFLLENSLFTE